MNIVKSETKSVRIKENFPRRNECTEFLFQHVFFIFLSNYHNIIMIIGELGVKKLRSHDRRAAFRATRSRIFVVFLFRGFSAKIERSFILAFRNKMVVGAMITSRFKVGGCLSGSSNGHLKYSLVKN